MLCNIPHYGLDGRFEILLKKRSVDFGRVAQRLYYFSLQRVGFQIQRLRVRTSSFSFLWESSKTFIFAFYIIYFLFIFLEFQTYKGSIENQPMEIWMLLFCHAIQNWKCYFHFGNVAFILLEMLLLFWKCPKKNSSFSNFEWHGKKVAFIFPLAGFQYHLYRFEPPKK